ncbi:hypothetical protein LMG29739_06350 [Paraburkholderia solisilvae]|uniref:Uncharacterized protein n=1 Tax=Paraburkholderia solisilvae TaxID=624376 RepID=A0A6J5F2E3_9BURK|nr:hypothetical protein LMG29739_06350 [Paraburkholderia solisilvae]
MLVDAQVEPRIRFVTHHLQRRRLSSAHIAAGRLPGFERPQQALFERQLAGRFKRGLHCVERRGSDQHVALYRIPWAGTLTGPAGALRTGPRRAMPALADHAELPQVGTRVAAERLCERAFRWITLFE